MIVQKFIEGFLGQFPRIDELIAEISLKWDIDTASDIKLDHIGELLTLPRLGANDTVYRRRIKAYIALANSEGNIESIIQVIKALTNCDHVRLINHGLGTFGIELTGDFIDEWGIDLIRSTPAAGCRVGEIYVTTPTAFRHDTAGVGLDEGEML